jgi:hypothetical protein
MRLPHTAEYSGVQVLSTWRASIMYMYTGKGTQSSFFPFEAERLRSFLNTWQ